MTRVGSVLCDGLRPSVPRVIEKLAQSLLRCSWIFLLALIAACHTDANSAQGVAERFIDQHYVMIDVKAAKAFSTGLALHKLENEEKLTEGQTIDATTRKPTVHYKLIEKRDSPEQPSFLFEGTIYTDGDSFTRKWLVTTRREGEAWKVSNFEEFE